MGALSSRPRQRTGGRCRLALFFSVFAFMGGGFLAALFLIPDVAEVEDWKPTPCVILGSEVESREPDAGGTTSSARIRYRYQRDGAALESDRHGLVAFSTSDRATQDAIVERLPAGRRPSATSIPPIRPALCSNATPASMAGSR